MIIMERYLMALGSIIIIYVSIINLNSNKFKLKEILGMIALTQVIASVLLDKSEYAAILPILIVPTIFIYRRSRSIVRSISIPIISIIIFVLSDYLMSNFYLSTFGITPDLIRENITFYWLAYTVDLIFVFLVTKVLDALTNKKIKIANIQFKGKFGLLIVISLVLTLIIFYTNIIFGSSRESAAEIIRINGVLFLSYFILLMIIMYILITSITKEMDLKNKQIQFENLQEYTSNLEKLYTDMRSFRHDYINILSSIIGYIQNKDIEGLEKHFNEKIFPLGKGMESNNFKIGLLKSIKIPEIKGIFSSKLIRAQELGIDVFIDILEPITKINMDIIDLSRVVGILLDNAIEAAEKCDKPSIKVGIINKEKSVLIVIINSVNEEVPIYKIYQKGFSTKGENRGLGLYNLKEITGKYTTVSLDTSIENGEFKQLLEILNK